MTTRKLDPRDRSVVHAARFTRPQVTRHARALGVAASAIAVLMMMPGVAQAGLTWSGPVGLYSGAAQTQPLSSIDCPSATQCTVVDGSGGELTFNPQSPGSPAPATIDHGTGLFGVDCPSESQCTAVDGHGNEVTFNPRSPGAPTVSIATDDVLESIACPTATQCTTVDNNGNELTFNPESPGTPTPVAIDDGDLIAGTLIAVSCPSESQCVAVDNAGAVVSFNPQSPGRPTPATIDAGNALTGVACPSTTQCTAVDSNGAVLTFSPASPGAASSTAIDRGTTLNGITCPSTTQCTAVDSTGVALTFNPGAAGSAISIPVDGGNSLTAIICSAVQQCVAADNAGNAFVGAPRGSTPSGNNSQPAGGGGTTTLVSASVGRMKIAGTTVSFTVGCTGSSTARCKLRITLTLIETIRRGKVIAVTAAKHKAKKATSRATKKTVVVGSAAVTLAAGYSKTVRIGLNSTGKRLLAKSHKLKVKLTVAQSVAARTHLVVARTVGFTSTKTNAQHKR